MFIQLLLHVKINSFLTQKIDIEAIYHFEL